MEKPLKKKKKATRPKRGLVLVLLGAALALGLGFWYLAWQKAHEIPIVPDSSTRRTLLTRKAEDVKRITVSRREGEGYTLLGQDGHLAVKDWPDFVMDSDMEHSLLNASAILSIEDTVSWDREEWEPALKDFGLASPAVTVEIAYADGGKAAFSLGDKAPDSNLRYCTLAGDPSLYLASADLMELFDQDVTAFHHVDQPLIHHQRIDRITLQDGSGGMEAAWELETGITNQDALSSWRMTVPFHYPCDASAMESLLSAVEKLYLGRFVSKATEEAKAIYGFAPPRRVITLHQAAGEIAAVGESGIYDATAYPESTLVLTVGGKQDEFTDYCQVGDTIYLVSAISQPLLNELVPESTLLLQPAAIYVDSIASLVVEKGQERREYVLRRQEKVLGNNELARDEEGNVLMDTLVSNNGKDTDFAAFNAVMISLQSVTVSGRLPGGFSPEGSPSLRLTFTYLDGRTRTLECTPFDALQDALGVDGTYLYYLPKGALDKGL